MAGERAVEIDDKLRSLLVQASNGHDVEEEILVVLQSTPKTHAWAANMLGDEDGLPPELQATRAASFAGLPGAGDPVDAARYVCPVDQAYMWWRMSVGDKVPFCRDHPHMTLEPG